MSDEKIWFIIVDHQREGPFSLLDLKKHRRFTPDTLVWKKGFKEWIAARHITEMRELFADETQRPQTANEKEKGKSGKPELGHERTMAFQNDPYFFILWLLVVLLILIYVFYQLIEK